MPASRRSFIGQVINVHSNTSLTISNLDYEPFVLWRAFGPDLTEFSPGEIVRCHIDENGGRVERVEKTSARTQRRYQRQRLVVMRYIPDRNKRSGSGR